MGVIFRVVFYLTCDKCGKEYTQDQCLSPFQGLISRSNYEIEAIQRGWQVGSQDKAKTLCLACKCK